MTANSFTSVSLTPPLVLWSASLYAQSLPAFQEGTHFVVNILAYDQIDLSNEFARKHENKFAEIDHIIPECGAPVLIGAAAHFECRNEYRHYGGDHIIFIGHVERYAYTNQADPVVLPRQIHARRAVAAGLTLHGRGDDALADACRAAGDQPASLRARQPSSGGARRTIAAAWRAHVVAHDMSLNEAKVTGLTLGLHYGEYVKNPAKSR